MSNFQSLLSKRVDEVERPKPIPVGHYVARVARFETTQNAKTGNNGIVFHFTLVEPQSDVNPEDLEAAGNIVGRTVRDTFWVTEDALFRLTEFLRDKLKLPTDSRSIGEVLPEAKDQFVIVELTQQMSQPDANNEVRMFTNIKSYSPMA